MSTMRLLTRLGGEGLRVSQLLRASRLGIPSRRHLPYCSVDTNLQNTQLSPDFNLRLSKCVANILGKDEKLVSVSVQTDVSLCRGGSVSPNAVVNIWSVAVFDAERNPGYTKQMYDFLLPELNMPADRIVLFFHPIEREAAGHLLYADLTSK